MRAIDAAFGTAEVDDGCRLGWRDSREPRDGLLRARQRSKKLLTAGRELSDCGTNLRLRGSLCAGAGVGAQQSRLIGRWPLRASTPFLGSSTQIRLGFGRSSRTGFWGNGTPFATGTPDFRLWLVHAELQTCLTRDDVATDGLDGPMDTQLALADSGRRHLAPLSPTPKLLVIAHGAAPILCNPAYPTQPCICWPAWPCISMVGIGAFRECFVQSTF